MGNYKSHLNQANEFPFHPSLPNPHVFIEKQEKLMTVRLASSKQDFNKWTKSKINYKQMIKHNRHLFWPREVRFQRIGFFGTTGFAVLTFPYCPVTLKDEIVNRTHSNIKFQQRELWYLLYSMVSLAEQVHRYGQTLGDIRPLNILLSEKGEIKILSKYSLPFQTHNLKKTMGSAQPTFLSPEQIEGLSKNEDSQSKLSPISESFSIGITMLMTSILRLGEEIYLPPKTLQKDILKQYKRQLQEQTTYDPNFKYLILGLCHENPTKRFTSFEIWKCLKQFQRNIYTLTSFQIKDFPSSVIRKQQRNKMKLRSLQQTNMKKQGELSLFKIFQNQQNQAEHTKSLEYLDDGITSKTPNASVQPKHQNIQPHYISSRSINKTVKENQNKFSAFKQEALEPHPKINRSNRQRQLNIDKSQKQVFINPQAICINTNFNHNQAMQKKESSSSNQIVESKLFLEQPEISRKDKTEKSQTKKVSWLMDSNSSLANQIKQEKQENSQAFNKSSEDDLSKKQSKSLDSKEQLELWRIIQGQQTFSQQTHSSNSLMGSISLNPQMHKAQAKTNWNSQVYTQKSTHKNNCLRTRQTLDQSRFSLQKMSLRS